VYKRLSGSLTLLRRTAARSLENRIVYQGMADIGRMFLLRLSHNRAVRRILPDRPMAINIRGLPSPVYVRAGTTDRALIEEIFEQGEYAEVHRFSIGGGARIMDLGANVGMTIAYLAARYPDAQFAAVEPDQGNIEVLRQTCTSLLTARRLCVFPWFVAADDGQARIDRTGGAWAYRKGDTQSTAREDDHEVIRCAGLLTLLRETGWDQIDLLKVDIEGSEAELFRDCSSWIGRVRNLVVETHPPYAPADLYRDLDKAGWHHDLLLEQPAGEQVVSFLRMASVR
jgi:FkbM family methyltransferase